MKNTEYLTWINSKDTTPATYFENHKHFDNLLITKSLNQ